MFLGNHTRQPADWNEFNDRLSADTSYSQLEGVAFLLMLATLTGAKEIEKISGLPLWVVAALGFSPSLFFTIKNWKKRRAYKAMIATETARREREAQARPEPAPISPDKIKKPIPGPTTAQIWKIGAYLVWRALWTVEVLTFMLALVTLRKGQQWAQFSGVSVGLIFAIGFAPAAFFRKICREDGHSREIP
ncbi:hypothetical protein EON80_16640 [bacterium]|nr:MAG: hypothetical protein EON80_16640 [bacterium]